MRSITIALLLFVLPASLQAADLRTASGEVRVIIKTLAARMKYDTTEFIVPPGAKVRLTLVNDDAMPHNLVVTRPATDKGFALAQAAWALGAQGVVKHWIPDDPRVLAATRMVQPRTQEELVFDAPRAVGAYPYVCTFPGHAMVMNGVMRVVAEGTKLTDGKFQLFLGKWDKLPDFSTLKPLREGPLEESLIQLKSDDYKTEFGLRFNGKIEVKTEGEHLFRVSSDDGSRLSIDGKVVVNNDGQHPADEGKTGRVRLKPGAHDFQLDYFQGGAGAGLYASWLGPGFSETWLTKRQLGAMPKQNKGDGNTGMPLITALGSAAFAQKNALTSEIIKAEREFYSVTTVSTPEEPPIEVSGLEMMPDGKLAVATRRGEIWMVTHPADAAPIWSRWAHGLHEPLGISFRDGWLWATQRPEVTLIKDTDGECFYTDNQGPWNGSSSLKHLKAGSFQGHPIGNNAFDTAAKKGISVGAMKKRPAEPRSGSRIDAERETVEEYVPPAVILPHGILGQSPTGMCYDSSGKFGPFRGQMFVSEQTFSLIQRVFLEKINGVWQGAAFHFLSGFGSGNIATLMTSDGILYTGGSDRGWGAKGGKSFALDRVAWTGKTPFEFLEMRAKSDGFELTFTQPADAKSVADPASCRAEAWTYIYQEAYGSPEVDKVTPRIVSATVGADGRSVRLKLEPLTKGHVHAISAPGLRNAEGKPLLHATGYYTLNEIPK